VTGTNWASWNDFIAMGGYGGYVWGSFLITFGALAAEIALLRLRRRRARQLVARADPNEEAV
jgi:heme exporter protein D